MATQLQVRRGTTSELQSFTGAEGEITVDTDKDTVVVHDGTTAGGHPLAKASQPRGWTLREHFLTDGTWTKSGKDGLKRIIVTVYGGGGGGGGGQDAYGASGGGQGGYGYVILDVSSVTDNVSVTIGQGGAGNGASNNTPGATGGTTSFGSYIEASGGEGGIRVGAANRGASAPGRITGTGTVELGGIPGGEAFAQTYNNWNMHGGGGGPGGGWGNGGDGIGCCGGGGAGGQTPGFGGNGAPGSVMVEEIYGEV